LVQGRMDRRRAGGRGGREAGWRRRAAGGRQGGAQLVESFVDGGAVRGLPRRHCLAQLDLQGCDDLPASARAGELGQRPARARQLEHQRGVCVAGVLRGRELARRRDPRIAQVQRPPEDAAGRRPEGLGHGIMPRHLLDQRVRRVQLRQRRLSRLPTPIEAHCLQHAATRPLQSRGRGAAVKLLDDDACGVWVLQLDEPLLPLGKPEWGAISAWLQLENRHACLVRGLCNGPAARR